MTGKRRLCRNRRVTQEVIEGMVKVMEVEEEEEVILEETEAGAFPIGSITNKTSGSKLTSKILGAIQILVQV